MQIYKDYSLKKHNTMRIDVNATYYVSVESNEQLVKVLANDEYKNLPILPLGKGANILFTKNFPGIVVSVDILGKKIIKEDDEKVYVEVGAGEDWCEFVEWAVNKDYCGIENLALIPGTVGAAPIQNIAAYGNNFSDVFHSLEAINIKTQEPKNFSKEECKFDYRESIFKNELKGQYIVTKVVIELSKKSCLDMSYVDIGKRESIASELKEIATEPYSVKDVYNAVVRIRSRKLPNVDSVGTAGSFFKNPVVTYKQLEYIKTKLVRKDIQFYPVDNLKYDKNLHGDEAKKHEKFKLPAGWLVDDLGWRGKRIGDVGTWDQQALAIVNFGNAAGGEVLDYVNKLKFEFKEVYGIELENEVIFI